MPRPACICVQPPPVGCSRMAAPIRRTLLHSLGKMPTTSARRFTSLFSRSSGLVLCPGAVLCGEGHAGKVIGLCIVHKGAQLRPFCAELVCDMAPGLNGAAVVGLNECLADRSGGHGVLAPGNIGERVAHGMNPASLSCRAGYAGDGGFQPFMSGRRGQA